jgi:hypothetical protein
MVESKVAEKICSYEDVGNEARAIAQTIIAVVMFITLHFAVMVRLF